MLTERVFTVDGFDPYESCGDTRGDSVPDILVAGLMHDVPATLQSIEENTLSSWLWRRRGMGDAVAAEISAGQIFDRIAGSATYLGWKKALFGSEAAARIFYDEIRFMLAHKIIALEPQQLAMLGGEWAYGVQQPGGMSIAAVVVDDFADGLPQKGRTSIRNATLDGILSNDAFLKSRWQTWVASAQGGEQLEVLFADTVNEWGFAQADNAPRLMVDLLQFRRDDGAIDAVALRQAVRAATILLELHYDHLCTPAARSRDLAIGYGNLAALLMASAIPYDSVQGRSTAAALSAIITAEATATSAELAGLLGPCTAFADGRETALRVLKNRRRAAYGERTDYERLSILPVSLSIDDGADLVLVATARHCWDEAMRLAQQNGLRHLQVTALFAAPEFAAYLNCSAQGVEAEHALVRYCAVGPEDYRRVIHPAVPIGLAQLGCDPADIKAIVDYAVGYQTLIAAPGVNHARLRAYGFDDAALDRIEAQLPRVSHIRHAFTPWIIGEKFCRETLKLKDKNLDDYAFDLLRHLGFSDVDVAAANLFCCGHGTLDGALELPDEGVKVFAAGGDMTQMAAAVQGFISGDVNLTLTMAGNASTEQRNAAILAAWRVGVKSVTLYFDFTATAAPTQVAKASRLLKRKSPAVAAPSPVPDHKPTMARMTSPRNAKPKATTRSVSLKRGKGKPGSGAGIKGH